jgi:hypothetical protein
VSACSLVVVRLVFYTRPDFRGTDQSRPVKDRDENDDDDENEYDWGGN